MNLPEGTICEFVDKQLPVKRSPRLKNKHWLRIKTEQGMYAGPASEYNERRVASCIKAELLEQGYPNVVIVKLKSPHPTKDLADLDYYLYDPDRDVIICFVEVKTRENSMYAYLCKNGHILNKKKYDDLIAYAKKYNTRGVFVSQSRDGVVRYITMDSFDEIKKDLKLKELGTSHKKYVEGETRQANDMGWYVPDAYMSMSYDPLDDLKYRPAAVNISVEEFNTRYDEKYHESYAKYGAVEV